MCQSLPQYKNFIIHEYKYWKIELHSNQSYLGRSLIILKRHLEDFFDISQEEEEELFFITRNFKNAVKKAFNPEMFNYASLGNESRHVHLHIVPRYSKSVNFHGYNFEDKRRGKNYSGYDKNFTIPEDVLMAIKDALNSNLE